MSTEYNLHCTDCGYGVWIASAYLVRNALFPTGERGERNLLRFLFDHEGHRLEFTPDRGCDLPEMDGDVIEQWTDDGDQKFTPVTEWAAQNSTP